MRIITVLAFVSLLPAADTSPGTALEWLKHGIERHVQAKYVHWHQSLDRRKEVAAGQHPHTIVLACSDSRVPPEILFDQGLGDLFVVRVAGNVVGDKELGSIEYAAGHLHAQLIVVLGHQRCGAVEAAVAGGEAPGHIGSLIAPILPAVEKAKATSGDPVGINVDMVVEQLRHAQPILPHLIREGKLKIAGAVYSLDTGEVRWRTPLPH